MEETLLQTVGTPFNKTTAENGIAANGNSNIPAVPSIAHLAGVWKDDPFYDELMESIEENRRAVNALYAVEADAGTSAEIESDQD